MFPIFYNVKGIKKILFTMTTNGTLMTEDVIEFLVKYEFNLMISLDGDKKSHDINRRLKQKRFI